MSRIQRRIIIIAFVNFAFVGAGLWIWSILANSILATIISALFTVTSVTLSILRALQPAKQLYSPVAPPQTLLSRSQSRLIVGILFITLLLSDSGMLWIVKELSPAQAPVQSVRATDFQSTLQLANPPFHTEPPTRFTYSFEDGGLDSWTKTGHISTLQNTMVNSGFDGRHSLQVTFFSQSAQDQPFISVNPSKGGPSSGQVLSAYVYVPGSVHSVITGQLYVQDKNNRWSQGGFVNLVAGEWNYLSFMVPQLGGSAPQLGLQFSAMPFNQAVTVYIDDIGWS
ncbi:hypothetical protein [Tengunoibacter tsumagoiensis]|uniref:Uncharacterized protein n=1 Tax=Tengunoibacter tsumagoiensis TaxID=2014871 RepID=A0A401ZV06_9CHLR|nr:hypothetical protein [Tengunoibacter tsumagoiensis]GCE10554.1 hypothetical protein KTT_04130 [Tengunoibacter tsumagoiensis]